MIRTKEVVSENDREDIGKERKARSEDRGGERDKVMPPPVTGAAQATGSKKAL